MKNDNIQDRIKEIFEKTEDFSEEALREFLESFDLSKVVIQGPKDAEWD